jgi:enamine deaminase RidA (YjgF/YER057c/UK114 family)
MTRRFLSTGSEFEKAVGYARAVVDRDMLVVSGVTGFDYATGVISEDPAAQAEQIFRTLRAVVAEAGFAFADIVKLTIICVDAKAWTAVTPVLGRHLPEARPAATAIIAGLVDPRMKVEIEAWARKRGEG